MVGPAICAEGVPPELSDSCNGRVTLNAATQCAVHNHKSWPAAPADVNAAAFEDYSDSAAHRIPGADGPSGRCSYSSYCDYCGHSMSMDRLIAGAFHKPLACFGKLLQGHYPQTLPRWLRIMSRLSCDAAAAAARPDNKTSRRSWSLDRRGAAVRRTMHCGGDDGDGDVTLLGAVMVVPAGHKHSLDGS